MACHPFVPSFFFSIFRSSSNSHFDQSLSELNHMLNMSTRFAWDVQYSDTVTGTFVWAFNCLMYVSHSLLLLAEFFKVDTAVSVP